MILEITTGQKIVMGNTTKCQVIIDEIEVICIVVPTEIHRNFTLQEGVASLQRSNFVDMMETCNTLTMLKTIKTLIIMLNH